MEDNKDVPAVKFSTCHLFTGTQETPVKFAETQTNFAPTAIIHPFHHYDIENENVTYRSPIVCINCGGFLSIHVVINPDTGEWCCPLCRNTNPKFHSNFNRQTSSKNCDQYLREIYPELQSKHCDFYETTQNDTNLAVSAYTDMYATVINPLHVFAIDLSMLRENSDDTSNLLYLGLRQLPKQSKVFILLFDAVVHILRLSTIDLDPIVAMDSLPGHDSGKNSHQNVYEHYVKRGVYVTSAEKLLQNYSILKTALFNMSPSKRHFSASTANNRHNVNGNDIDAPIKCATVNVLLQTSLAMMGLPVLPNKLHKIDTSELNNHAVKLVAFTDRLLPLSSRKNYASINTENTALSILNAGTPQSELSTSLLTAYQRSGKYALHNNLSVDVFYHSGNHVDYTHIVDKYEALCTASGGNVVCCGSYADNHTRLTFGKLMASSALAGAAVTATEAESAPFRNVDSHRPYKIDTRASKMATVEVRTCGKVAVEQMVGSIVPVEDTIYHRNNASPSKEGGKIVSGHQITVDKRQLESTLAAIDSCSTGKTDKSYCDQSESIYYKAIQHNEQRNTVCTGVLSKSHNYDGNTMLSVLFAQTDSAAPAHKYISATQAVQNLFGTNLLPRRIPLPFDNSSDLPMYSDAADEDKRVDHFGSSSAQGEKEAYLDGAFVQIVVRYEQFNFAPPHVSGNKDAKHGDAPHHISSITRVTRVLTVRLETTDDHSEYLRDLDESLYGVVAARGLVADYHSEGLEAFRGVRRSKLDEQGNYMHSSLKVNAYKAVDREVERLGLQQCPSGNELSPLFKCKALSLCRMMHALREGPMLDGPSMQAVDSYMLRCLFLKASYAHAARMLLPTVKLVSLVEGQETGVAQKNEGDGENLADQRMLYPPPSTVPPIGSASGLVVGSQALHPPAGPYPAHLLQDSATFSNPVKSTGSTATQNSSNSSSGLLAVHTLPAESMSLLPRTIALLDYGDLLVVRNNGDSEDGGDSVNVDGNTGKDSELDEGAVARKKTAEVNVTKQLRALAQQIALSRYPVPPVHMVSDRHSPLNRVVFSRLSPTHCDLRHNLLHDYCCFDTSAATVTTAGAGTISPNSQNTGHSSVVNSFVRSCRLSERDVDYMVGSAPITEQPFLAKYLLSILKSPAAVYAITHSSEDSDEVETMSVRQASASGVGSSVKSPSTTVSAPPLTITMDRGDGSAPPSSMGSHHSLLLGAALTSGATPLSTSTKSVSSAAASTAATVSSSVTGVAYPPPRLPPPGGATNAVDDSGFNLHAGAVATSSEVRHTDLLSPVPTQNISPEDGSSGKEGVNATVWSDITSIFSNLVPTSGAKKENKIRDVDDFA